MVVDVTGDVVTVKFAELEVAATATLEGTLAAELELERPTRTPFFGSRTGQVNRARIMMGL